MKLKHYGSYTYFIDNFTSNILHRASGLIIPQNYQEMREIHYINKQFNSSGEQHHDCRFLIQIEHSKIRRAWCYWPSEDMWQEVDFQLNQVLSSEVQNLAAYRDLT